MITFNPASPAHISALLFGGSLKDSEVILCCDVGGNPVLIKSGLNTGQAKTKKQEVIVNIKGLRIRPSADIHKDIKTKKEGVYKTGEEVLSQIAKTVSGDAKEICETMLKIRELEKQIQTYYTSVEELIYPDSCVHPSFIHVSTGTGRLSCKAPNVQNVPTGYSKVKEHFVSRFGTQGSIVSADYKALEVRIEAQLSGDQNYINDICSGLDIHTKNLALKKSVSYEYADDLVRSGEWSDERTKVKPFTFVMQYGGGVKAVAEKSGMSVDEVKDLLQARQNEYPRLYLYYEWLDKVVNKQGWYKDPWGKRYYFKKYPAPDWLRKKGVQENYSPTEVRNYRTQGFATGTIVLIMLGHFWRQKALHNRDKYLLINTVHDSVMLDCKEKFVENAQKDLQILKDVAIISLREFNYEFKVPIDIDIKVGQNWLEC